MATAWQEGDQAKKVVSPVSLIISAFASVQDVRKTTTPLLKLQDESGAVLETELILIDLGRGKNRMAGSILAQVLNQSGKSAPNVDHPEDLTIALMVVYLLVSQRWLLHLTPVFP
jgi:phosphoribosylformylglycinamidine synthase